MTVRKLGGVLSVLLVFCVMEATAQDGASPPCECKRREVGDSGSRNDWAGYGKTIRWHSSVDEAMKIAKAENKLVFWYHVAGDLDKEGC